METEILAGETNCWSGDHTLSSSKMWKHVRKAQCPPQTSKLESLGESYQQVIFMPTQFEKLVAEYLGR